MPRCLNNAKVSCTGREPSPKGLGYASRSEPVGSEMLGRDGNRWIVAANAKGTRRRVKTDLQKYKRRRSTDAIIQ